MCGIVTAARWDRGRGLVQATGGWRQSRLPSSRPPVGSPLERPWVPSPAPVDVGFTSLHNRMSRFLEVDSVYTRPVGCFSGEQTDADVFIRST